ncbi:MAG: disulfide reductase [Gammaproteobacteria bacterium]|nr:disulfide reductase [Gammaproteobacteria bacterium]
MPADTPVHIPYYPGCTLKTKAGGYERSAMDCARALGFFLDEITEWNCCGASFPLTKSNVMGLAAPTNVLMETEKYCRKQGIDPHLITLCSFCYNTLKRTDFALSEEPEKLKTLNQFLNRDYKGTVRVVHYLEYLRDVIGFDNLAKMVKTDMSSVRVAPYYGCLLLKPKKEIGLDDPEEPTIIHDFLDALGCQVVDFPGQVDCCGSYLIMREPEKVLELSYNILSEADSYGAHAVVTACPLCHSNLDKSQGEMRSSNHHVEFQGVPILYFTQLLAIALGLDTETYQFENHHIDPRPAFLACGIDDQIEDI